MVLFRTPFQGCGLYWGRFSHGVAVGWREKCTFGAPGTAAHRLSPSNVTDRSRRRRGKPASPHACAPRGTLLAAHGNAVGNRRPPHACAPTGHASRSPWQRRGMATPWDGNAVRFTGEQAPRDLTEAVNPTQRDLGAEGRPRHITRQTAWNRQLSPAQRGGFCNVLIKRLFVLKSWTGSSFGVAS